MDSIKEKDLIKTSALDKMLNNVPEKREKSIATDKKENTEQPTPIKEISLTTAQSSTYVKPLLNILLVFPLTCQ